MNYKCSIYNPIHCFHALLSCKFPLKPQCELVKFLTTASFPEKAVFGMQSVKHGKRCFSMARGYSRHDTTRHAYFIFICSFVGPLYNTKFGGIELKLTL